MDTFAPVPMSDLSDLQRRVTLIRADELIDADNFTWLNDKIGDFICEQYRNVSAHGHTRLVVRTMLDLARAFNFSDQQFALQLHRKVIPSI